MRGLNPLPQGGGYEGPNQPSYLIKANLKLFSGLLWRTSHTLLPSLKPKKGHSWDALNPYVRRYRVHLAALFGYIF